MAVKEWKPLLLFMLFWQCEGSKRVQFRLHSCDLPYKAAAISTVGLKIRFRQYCASVQSFATAKPQVLCHYAWLCVILFISRHDCPTVTTSWSVWKVCQLLDCEHVGVKAGRKRGCVESSSWKCGAGTSVWCCSLQDGESCLVLVLHMNQPKNGIANKCLVGVVGMTYLSGGREVCSPFHSAVT